MKDNGLKINNTASVLKDGLMVLPTRVNTLKVKSMAKANLLGLIIALTQEISWTTTFMEQVSMSGPTVESIPEIGKITKWKVMEHLLGQMAESM